MSSRLVVIIVLGTTQTLAWASSYYLPAILADRIAGDIGISSTWFFAAFSSSLVISALIGPRVGRTIDAIGGREVLIASNIVIAVGLIVLAAARSPQVLWIAWLILGVGMGLGLYDTAFATLGRVYGNDARGAITGITLIAGFASTVGWPLTAWGASEFGWRETCLAWATAHLFIGLPLNWFLVPLPANLVVLPKASAKPRIAIDRTMIVLAFAFSCSWMVVAAMAVHLPRLLEAAGATNVQAVWAGAMIGPAQVAARIMEASLLKRFHPLVTARLAVMLHPIGAGVLALAGADAGAGVFAVLHGAGSGILTIARGTVPLAIFGAENYGYRLGLLGAPSRITTAAAPLLFGVLIERFGAGALVFSSALSAAALLGLCSLPQHRV
jgi:predicted MFS family arabinose efflux permease